MKYWISPLTDLVLLLKTVAISAVTIHSIAEWSNKTFISGTVAIKGTQATRDPCTQTEDQVLVKWNDRFLFDLWLTKM
jgi:hypothetical protein